MIVRGSRRMAWSREVAKPKTQASFQSALVRHAMACNLWQPLVTRLLIAQEKQRWSKALTGRANHRTPQMRSRKGHGQIIRKVRITTEMYGDGTRPALSGFVRPVYEPQVGLSGFVFAGTLFGATRKLKGTHPSLFVFFVRGGEPTVPSGISSS